MHATVKKFAAAAVLSALTAGAATQPALAGPMLGTATPLYVILSGALPVKTEKTFEVLGGTPPYRIDKVSGPTVAIVALPKKKGLNYTFSIIGDEVGVLKLNVVDAKNTVFTTSVSFLAK